MKKLCFYDILLFMKFIGCFFLSSAIVGGTMACHAAGFLTAESFPGTFQDLSFETRLEILADGYDDVGVEYDENGRCVSGCAYTGITLAEEEYLISVAQEELNKLVEQEQHATVPTAVSAPATPKLIVNVSGTTGKPGQSSGSVSVGQGAYFRSPVNNNVIVVSDFGERRPPKTKNGTGSRYHRGLDLRATMGTPLYAAADGVVVEAGWKSGYGNAVVIEHSFKNSDKTVKTLYGHLSSMNVKKGATVKQGDLIGKAGNSGNSGAAHLHYELRFNDMRVDPLGSQIKPILDTDATAAAATRGTNYLGTDYCFKSGITSKRLAPYSGNDTALRENFPGCRGWCN